MTNAHDHNDVEALRSALFGRSVVSVQMFDNGPGIDQWGPQVQGEVRLDDGRVLKLAGNGPDCACSAGDYNLAKLNDMPINGITDVQVQVDEAEIDEWGEGEKVYRLFVLAQDNRIELATFEGDDGNGYYGTGFWFSVTAPEETQSDE